MYDPEAHAETAVQQLLAKSDLRNEVTGVTREMVSNDTESTGSCMFMGVANLCKRQADIYMNYWLPDGSLKVKSLL